MDCRLGQIKYSEHKPNLPAHRDMAKLHEPTLLASAIAFTKRNCNDYTATRIVTNGVSLAVN